MIYIPRKHMANFRWNRKSCAEIWQI